MRAFPEISIERIEALVREQRERLAAVGPVIRPAPTEMRICGVCGVSPSPSSHRIPKEEPKPPEPKPPRSPSKDDGPGMGLGFVLGVVTTLVAVWILN